jgi:hypothetical protein
MKKELLSLAGEHRVASELCKLGVFATITPGNRKQTDIYAINDDTSRHCRIEVKTTQARGFLTGINQRKNKGNGPDFWVLVLFKDGIERFFVLSNHEIEKLQKKVNDKWLEGYRNRHDGKEYDIRTGVDSLPILAIENASCENRWDKIESWLAGKSNKKSRKS